MPRRRGVKTLTEATETGTAPPPVAASEAIVIPPATAVEEVIADLRDKVKAMIDEQVKKLPEGAQLSTDVIHKYIDLVTGQGTSITALLTAAQTDLKALWANQSSPVASNPSALA